MTVEIVILILEMDMKITAEQARSLFLRKQFLSHARLPQGKPGVLRTIEKLGYVQIDTINVVERSHHVVLFTRCPDYKHQYLHALQAKDKKIFEYWAHAASFISFKNYRYYLSTMKRKPKKGSWLDTWIKKNRTLIRKVKTRVVREGPLAASDFGDVKERKRGTWWDWKPAKMALEVLFWQGELMIKERRNFQRIYDVTERVIPDNVDTTKPAEDEEKKFFIRRALGALGIGSTQDINRYIGVGGRLSEWVDLMHENDEIVKVKIADFKKSYYMLKKDAAEVCKDTVEKDARVRLLSPFDNSIILRERTRELFGFKYSLECYVPRARRKYGYFCLPILWRNQLVGRIDPKADRQNKKFIINNLHIEDKKLDHKTFIPALSQCLKEFAHFHECDEIELNKNIPARMRRMLSNF